MFEIIFIVVKVLGMLLLVGKAINAAGQMADTGEVRNLMAQSLTIRAGNLAPKQ